MNNKTPEQKNGAPNASELVELQVWSVPAVNRALVICHAPDRDGSDPMNLVSVQVRDNAHFLKKMTLKARTVSAKRYILEGPCPRFRGRW